MGRMSLGCCSSSGPAPSASGASPGTRLWDPLVLRSTSTSGVSLMTEETLTPAQLNRELERIAWGQAHIRDLPSHNLRPPRPAWPRRVKLECSESLCVGLNFRGSRAVSSAVSFSRHSVDLRAWCYDTDAQDLA